MILRVPAYFDTFQCIAKDCKDSCCIGWEIEIDQDSVTYYKEVEGPFGERLRANMKQDGENSFVLKEGRCPFLNTSNLCDIYTELGEEALCHTCTQFPRVTVEYGEVIEKCLSISCEEAARIIVGGSEPVTFLESEIEAESDSLEEMDEEEERYLLVLQRVRDVSLSLLQDRSYSLERRLCHLLLYCEGVQRSMNEERLEDIEFDYNKVITTLKEEKDKYKDKKTNYHLVKAFIERMELFGELEVLDATWKESYHKVRDFFSPMSEEQYLAAHQEFALYSKDRTYEYEHIMVYFITRYFMKAFYDYNVLGKVKLAITSFLVIRDMEVEKYFANQGEGKRYTLADRIEIIRIYSKEVEHSEENVESIEEMFLFEDVFSTEEMLVQIELYNAKRNG